MKTSRKNPKTVQNEGSNASDNKNMTVTNKMVELKKLDDKNI